MICEKCAGEVETILCGRCGASVVKLGPYCYGCGQALDKDAPEKDREADEIDLSTRILCSDDACIGVVNEEGFCKVCGKPYTPVSEG
jgi:hypothetical protein